MKQTLLLSVVISILLFVIADRMAYLQVGPETYQQLVQARLVTVQ